MELLILQKVKHLECCIKIKEAFIDIQRLEIHIVMELSIPFSLFLDHYAFHKKEIDILHINTIVYQLACAIATLCKHGLVHNDVKPVNMSIFYPKSDRVILKMLDFGLAQNHIEGDNNTNMIAAGTGRFMSPETTKVAGCQKRDVWAVGISTIDILNVGCLNKDGGETENVGEVPVIRREIEDGSMLDTLTKQALERVPSKRATAAKLVEVSPHIKSKGVKGGSLLSFCATI
jgi:serine/threonine protein kinase